MLYKEKCPKCKNPRMIDMMNPKPCPFCNSSFINMIKSDLEEIRNNFDNRNGHNYDRESEDYQDEQG